MLVRGTGRTLRRPPRGEVVRVVGGVAAADCADPCVSASWRAAVAEATAATVAGRVLAVVGEPGSGRSTLASVARRAVSSRPRLLHARTPVADDVGPWLELWTPALADEDTCVIVSGVEELPAWAAEELAAVLAAARRPAGTRQPFVLTAPGFGALPEALAPLVDAVVEVAPLRHRAEDVLPLAAHLARLERHRPVDITARAARALAACAWPGNAGQLRRVVREAVARTDVIDLHHLAPEVFSGGRRPLTRLEALERDEIVRCLTEPDTTVAQAAEKLGIGRATIYRKIAQYDIQVPARTGGTPS
jgi:hypothetical protein